MKDFESTIIEKCLTITKLESEFDKVKQFKLENEVLKKQLRQREEEAGVLRAKLFLDMYTVNLKIVPEYPDLLEENQLLNQDISDKD
jgi:hypothetical protein